MTVLHHALCGDDFDQTPVSKIFRETVQIYFLVLWAMQHRCVFHSLPHYEILGIAPREIKFCTVNLSWSSINGFQVH